MTGQKPGALEERPIIFPAQAFYLDAFYELSAARNYSGMGSPLPIVLSEVAAYFWIYDIKDLEARQTFITHIRALDAAWFERRDVESKRAKPTGTDSE